MKQTVELASSSSSVYALAGFYKENTSNGFVVNPGKKDFAPRIGIAYMLNGQTVVRAGFGIFYGGLENLGFRPQSWL